MFAFCQMFIGRSNNRSYNGLWLRRRLGTFIFLAAASEQTKKQQGEKDIVAHGDTSYW